MPANNSFDYAVIRIVPRVERGEFINAGIVLFSRPRRYLAAAIELDEARLRALDENFDMEAVRTALDAIKRIAAGDSERGPIAELSPAERFHWLTSPRSTVVQPSPVHSGQCEDLDATLERLMGELVRRPG